MENTLLLANCLSGCLTILVKLNIIDEQQTLQIIDEKGYEGLFDFINDKFIEIKSK
jgi:hypothetical protein